MTREKAISQIKWYFEEDDGGAAEDITKEAVSMAIEALESQTPTADVVEVVRCKHCKWASNDCEWCLSPYSPVCGDDATHLYIEPNWFCPDGERKEKE